MQERTLTILKPDAYMRGLLGQIITKIEQHHFKIVAAKILQLTKAEAEDFYSEHKGKYFFDAWTTFMSSDYIMALVLEKKDAIHQWRELMGPLDFKPGNKTTIRGKWATARNRNLVHGSDSPESAEREIQWFFE